jgi:hypothetical protein
MGLMRVQRADNRSQARWMRGESEFFSEDLPNIFFGASWNMLKQSADLRDVSFHMIKPNFHFTINYRLKGEPDHRLSDAFSRDLVVAMVDNEGRPTIYYADADDRLDCVKVKQHRSLVRHHHKKLAHDSLFWGVVSSAFQLANTLSECKT